MSAISIKGTRSGLVICVKTKYKFEDIRMELISRLESARGFFKGARFNIHGCENLEAEQRQVLKNICLERGMILDSTISLPSREIATFELPNPGSHEGGGNVILRKNIRSGQKVIAKKDLVIIGNVNPGAELIAGGSIFVMGSLKGVAHAGAYGDTSASIMAHEMQPSQIRIGHIVACRPDQDCPEVNHPEIAYVVDNKIVIDKYKNKNLGVMVSA